MQGDGFRAYTEEMRTLILLAVAYAALPLGALAQERIISFEAEYAVRQDAMVEVREHIVYDFGAGERHGIYREIPYRYSSGAGSYTADITGISVSNPEGGEYEFDTSRSGGFLNIRIGDPDEIVTGVHDYIIEYLVERPILYLEGQDEFYWNVTGEGWGVPIETVRGSVAFPPGTRSIEASCYAGTMGGSAPCMRQDRTDAGYSFSAGPLAPYEGVTVAVAFPKGAIYEPTRAERIAKWLSDNSIIFLPLLTLLVAGFLWTRRGRDPRGRVTIIPQYEPPAGLTPAEAGVVYDEFMHAKDLTAEIIYLATRGYIHIHRLDEKMFGIFPSTDYMLEQKKGAADLANVHDRLIMESLFKSSFGGTKTVEGREVQGTLLSKLKGSFSSERSAIIRSVYSRVVAEKYFPANPNAVRAWYAVGGVAGAIGAGVAWILVSGSMTGISAASIILSALIMLGIAFIMPRRTPKGVAAREHILGFRRYLSVAEKDRLKFHNTPEKKPEVFEAMLPYAIALGVEKEWASQFKDMHLSPTWYSGHALHSFAAADLSRDLSSFGTAIAAASAPQSSGSGGGGSVGGGFGGGGGGSW